MINLKPEYKIQIKISNNRWEMTQWDENISTLASCKAGLKRAKILYDETYRIIKIYRSYEVME